MPLRLDEIELYGAPIFFLKKGEVQVRVGPNGVTFFKEQKIPLDGRHYICSGTVILKNGTKLHANFEISTHTFDFLERDSVKVYIENERAWYYLNEQELYNTLGLIKEEFMPYTWLPDRPLDYYKQGPYPKTWPDSENS